MGRSRGFLLGTNTRFGGNIKKIIYSTEHPSYIKLSGILSEHGLMGAKEDILIQAILNVLLPKNTLTENDCITQGIDILGDEWEY